MMSAHLEKRSAMVPFFPRGVTMDSSLAVTLRDCDPHWLRLNGATDAILDHCVKKKSSSSLNKRQRDDKATRVMRHTHTHSEGRSHDDLRALRVSTHQQSEILEMLMAGGRAFPIMSDWFQVISD